ncbi:MAG: Zn-ribbon domain-containing OB-fold protein [Proteobacteria bacterium]|nr:Zn-ribbon domain-containing OB-fold protein [Pseudomonadota bacterium]MBK8957275.1 Zn-ribbon domain-containing OB-fold protein [Pseudomonadota bacterium]
MTETVTKPEPPESALSAPYWQGLRDGRLLLQACGACGTLRHYPRLLCSACFSDAVSWRQASGHGHVHSWTVAHHAFHVGFRDELPYTLVTVDLAEGPRALGRWRGATPRIGLAVKAILRQADAAAVELWFEPDGEA